MPSDEMPLRIFHLALKDEWQQALESGDGYDRSTLGSSLDDEGFIHCSFANQVQTIADLIYAGREDVVLLAIDVARLTAELKVESLDGTPQRFPHIYGSLHPDAVLSADPVPMRKGGTLDVSSLLP